MSGKNYDLARKQRSAERLKGALHGRAIREIAEASGLSYPLVRRWISDGVGHVKGKRSRARLLHLCEVLGFNFTSVEELWLETEPPIIRSEMVADEATFVLSAQLERLRTRDSAKFATLVDNMIQQVGRALAFTPVKTPSVNEGLISPQQVTEQHEPNPVTALPPNGEIDRQLADRIRQRVHHASFEMFGEKEARDVLLKDLLTGRQADPERKIGALPKLGDPQARWHTGRWRDFVVRKLESGLSLPDAIDACLNEWLDNPEVIDDYYKSVLKPVPPKLELSNETIS